MTVVPQKDARNFLLAEITNAAWTDFSTKFGLPDHARPRLEEVLYLYRAWQGADGLKSPGETKRNLKELTRTLDQSIDILDGLFSNPRAAVGLAIAMKECVARPTPPLAGTIIRGWIEHIEQIRTLARKAENAIAEGRKGAWEQARLLEFFVNSLDGILLEFTGNHIDRSRKGANNARDYVIAACELADPNIGRGSIEEAMKVIIKARSNKPKKNG